MPRPEGRGLWLSVFNHGLHIRNQFSVFDLFFTISFRNSYHFSYPTNACNSESIALIVFHNIAVF